MNFLFKYIKKTTETYKETLFDKILKSKDN